MAVQTPPSFSISCRQMSCHMDYFADAFVKRRGQTCFKISFSFIGLREASRAAASAKEPWLSNWLAMSAMWTSCKHTVSDRMEHQGIGYCSRLKKAVVCLVAGALFQDAPINLWLQMPHRQTILTREVHSYHAAHAEYHQRLRWPTKTTSTRAHTHQQSISCRSTNIHSDDGNVQTMHSQNSPLTVTQ